MSQRVVNNPDETAKPPEFRYDNLLRIASWTIPYVPIFESWENDCNEYRRGDVEIEVVASEFQLPDVFRQNALPPRIQKRLDDGLSAEQEVYHEKCRFVRYRPDIHAPGTSKLKFELSKTDYRDYLRSGECLDRMLYPTQPNDSQTFRDEFTPRITTSQEFDSLPLTNICGVGIFLITADNKVLISRHSESVEVCRGVLSYSASGTMDWNRVPSPFSGSPAGNSLWLDFLHPFTQVARECWEETRHQTSENLTLFGLGIDSKRLYFQFSFFEHTPRSSVDILNEAHNARDYHMEFAGKEGVDLGKPLNAVDFELDEIIRVLRNNDWEPAAKASLLALCAREFGIDRVERSIDIECVRERWRKEMTSEWRQRATRHGELAVMSSRYPTTRCSTESRKFVEAAFAFGGSDFDDQDVLEIGAGTGRFTKRLVDRAKQLTCIDFSAEMIARNRERLGSDASKVTYLQEFAQEYRPEKRHDVVISSLVLVHNVDDDAFGRLVESMCASADTVFLFEHIDDPRMPHPHTRLRREEDILAAFSNYSVARRSVYFLFEDQIVFLKLVRKDATFAPPTKRARIGEAPKPSRSPGQPIGSCYKYNAFISYRHLEPDWKMARSLLSELETAGYRVAIDERDFHPAATLLQEMERCIEESRFTLVIASPRYFLSGYALEEAIICRVLDLEGRTRRILPITIEKADFPAWLFNIVGIDFTTADPLVPPLQRLKTALGEPLP